MFQKVSDCFKAVIDEIPLKLKDTKRSQIFYVTKTSAHPHRARLDFYKKSLIKTFSQTKRGYL